MKNKIIRAAFLALFLFTISFAIQAQDDAAYRKALGEAPRQSAPSEYRARAFVKYLDALENTRMSERELNQFVADKFRELMEIDFYAAFLAQSLTTADFIKWHEVFELLPAEPAAAIKRLGQWKAGGGSKAAYPAGIPQPGSGWRKTVSSSVRPAETPAAETNTARPTPAAPVSSGASSSEAFKLGSRQLDEKDYDGAIRSFSECIGSNPKADGCYFNRGLANYRKGNYRAAVADYSEVIKIDPRREQAFINRGLAYSQQEDHEAAIADLEAALKINPNNEKVKEVLQATREYQAAKKNYVSQTDKQSKLSDDYLQQGNTQFGQKNWNEAIALYTKCIEASPLNLDCYNYRGLAYGAMKDYDKAIVDFTAILLFKQVPKIYFRRALAYRDKKDFDAAIRDFSEAIKLAPGDAENYMERGATYFYKGDPVSANNDLSQAIRLNPQEPKYYFIRGYASQAAGNREPAIADYRKALQLDPNFAAAKQQLRSLGVEP